MSCDRRFASSRKRNRSEPSARFGRRQVRVALPLGQDDHHERRADADGLARRQPRRARRLPRAVGLAPDLHAELDVLAVVENARRAGALSAAVAPEDLVERLLDRACRQEQQLLRLAVAERAEDLIHALDAADLRADAVDAAEPEPGELVVQPAHLVGGLADLHVDAPRDVLGRAAQVGLLPRESPFEHIEVVAQALEARERLVDVGDLGGHATPGPVPHARPTPEGALAIDAAPVTRSASRTTATHSPPPRATPSRSSSTSPRLRTSGQRAALGRPPA